MSLVARQLPALYNGVSQQPATTRLPSQAQAQVNAWSSVVDGLRKRPPSEHVVKLSASDLSAAYTHIINRDVTERYIVVLTDGDLKVYDLNGVEKTVAFPGRLPWAASTAYSVVNHTVRPVTPNGFIYRVKVAGTSGVTQPTWPTTVGGTVVDGTVTFECLTDYLNVTDATEDFACVTVADYTFILNKSIKPVMEAVAADQVAQAPFTYSLNRKLKGVAALAAYIAAKKQYEANPPGTLKGTKQTVQDIPDSPAPIDGDVWEIQGTADSNFATYYVVRAGGVWNEHVKPGLSNSITPSTMPHALVRLADGTFEFAPFSWAPRRVGSEDTNPNPTFIGRSIRDIFFYKNRLGFCVDENVVLSRAGDFGNFYRLTVLDLLDDATVDVAASTTKVTKFNHAVPFNKSMMLFADQVQFVLADGGVLSPGSVSLDVATQYEVVQKVRPEALGSDVYFVSENGDHARVLEYFVREGDNGTEAADVTAHVPRYIPAGTRALFGSNDHDLLCLITDGAANRLYTYKFYWTNSDDKAQSAWSYWEFPATDTLLDGAVLDNHVWLIVKRSDGTYLEKCNLESSAVPATLSTQVYLDRRVSATGVWLAGEGKTEFTLPYPIASLTGLRIVRGPDFTTATAALIPTNLYEYVTSTTVKVLGNYSAGECYLGRSYEFRYTFSEQFMKNGADVPITTGRMQLRTWTVYYTDTAYFGTEVAPYGTDVETEEVITAKFAEFTGKTLGNAELTIGTPTVHEGSYSFQVYGNADVAVISLVNGSHVACNFQAAEWEGFYQNRISRLV